MYDVKMTLDFTCAKCKRSESITKLVDANERVSMSLPDGWECTIVLGTICESCKDK